MKREDFITIEKKDGISIGPDEARVAILEHVKTSNKFTHNKRFKGFVKLIQTYNYKDPVASIFRVIDINKNGSVEESEANRAGKLANKNNKSGFNLGKALLVGGLALAGLSLLDNANNNYAGYDGYGDWGYGYGPYDYGGYDGYYGYGLTHGQYGGYYSGEYY